MFISVKLAGFVGMPREVVLKYPLQIVFIFSPE